MRDCFCDVGNQGGSKRGTLTWEENYAAKGTQQDLDLNRIRTVDRVRWTFGMLGVFPFEYASRLRRRENAVAGWTDRRSDRI
jgi:hypothetical protein